jgi:hypothetical protein
LSRTGTFVIAAVVLVIVVVGAVLVARSTGGRTGAARTLSVDVSGDRMTPDTLSAGQNDQLTLHVTADKKEEIHLHGYNIVFEVPAAGQTVTHSFKADKTGSFEIEIEDTSTHLGQLNVTP